METHVHSESDSQVLNLGTRASSPEPSRLFARNMSGRSEPGFNY